jgi:hypothetical protein
MSAQPGPYRTSTSPTGVSVPWYVIPYDRDGRCVGPRTRDHLLDALRRNEHTHVFLFSHGWNNDWKTATRRYEKFIDGFSALLSAPGVVRPLNFRPVLIGVFWPSTALVLPWERAPRIAAIGSPQAAALHDEASEDLFSNVEELARDLDHDACTRLYELADSTELTPAQAKELAELLRPVFESGPAAGDPTDLTNDAPFDPDRVVADWSEASRALAPAPAPVQDDEDEADYGTASPHDSTGTGAPGTAGLLPRIPVRDAIRMTTVWKMKDRAGTVGARGVGPLLNAVLNATTAPVHAIGHSYGAKVIMSAIAAQRLPRKVKSVLLLQPAISHLAFAQAQPGRHAQGGYRDALQDVTQPVTLTFTRHDTPLHRVFHLAVRRKRDLAEIAIAAEPSVPSLFAALGGYGPRGAPASERTSFPIRDPGNAYPELDDALLRLVALDGERTIKGHGDISQPATFWALYEQLRR